ncbi:hypothetical protein EYF80_021342 [Liparis tanakae]|uniref:Uncharacterized protein n=1 Tax=Liparis tanakae TaxID=230148 RepID=A0A4Z2HS93_9TELE|nr:hypothetical protein EYF80_021342 [Liparis tanakae]
MVIIFYCGGGHEEESCNAFGLSKWREKWDENANELLISSVFSKDLCEEEENTLYLPLLPPSLSLLPDLLQCVYRDVVEM